MTLAARFSLLHSDLNEFLFASVGDEQNGMPLNVISGLTRLGIDPWEEAARLANVPKARAAELLAPMIAQLPIGRRQPSDDMEISQRLVKLLPTRGSVVSSPTLASAKDNNYFRAVMLLACLALGAAVLTAIL